MYKVLNLFNIFTQYVFDNKPENPKKDSKIAMLWAYFGIGKSKKFSYYTECNACTCTLMVEIYSD